MNDDVSLLDLLRSFWRAKIYMIFCALVTLMVAFIFISVSIPEYRATMIVAPADGYALGDYAPSVDNSRIAALPFWRPKDSEGASTDFYRFIYTMRGAEAAKILMQDQSVVSNVNGMLKKPIKTPEELSLYLTRNIQIDPLGATPLRRLIYKHENAEFSAALLRKLHLVADQMIRRDRRRQSQSRIEYLENSLRKTNNPDHRKGITNLLMQQEHVQMLANLDEAYAAIVVEPPSATPRPVWPNKALIYSAALLMGLLFGFLIWSLRHAKK
jgi:hypothetical protein